MTRRLDEVLGQLTVDVPEAPSVEELRSRVGSRHRRPVPLVAVLIGLVVVAVVFVRLSDERSGDEAPAARPERRSGPPLSEGPRSFELSISVGENPLVEMRQFDRPTWEWIAEDFFALRMRIVATSTSRDPVQLTAPTWERRTDDGVTFLGNDECATRYVCLDPNEIATLRHGREHEFGVFVQPRLAALEDHSFSTTFEYENLTTGETGTIPVQVDFRVWEPEPGTEPPPMPVSTIMWPASPSPSTTATL
jgi:hypothetical protein